MFVATEGPPNAKIMIVGEAPGKDEDVLGKPFVGYAGRTLNQLLAQAGIPRHECLITNVARERPPGNRISFYFEDSKCTKPKQILKDWIELLRREILLYKPNLIIAMGNTSLWALTGERKISEFRGYAIPSSLVPGIKVLATYHPQAVNHEWKLFFPTVLDLRKAKRHSAYPDFPEDKRVHDYDMDPSRFISYMESLIEDSSIEKIFLDIENTRDICHTSILGIAHSRNYAANIAILRGKSAAMSENQELKVWQTLAELVKRKKVGIQNAPHDMGMLWYRHHILIENLWIDTLLAAHCCWPEAPRSLSFLASICLDVPPWKGSSKDSPFPYNCADCTNGYGVAEVLEAEVDRLGVRKTLDFEMSEIQPALTLQLQGIYVDKKIQKELKEETQKAADTALATLKSILKRDINYNSSKQLQQLLYIDLGLPIQYKRRKSVNDPRVVTADANALAKLALLVPDNPIFNLVLDYKKKTHMIKSFLNMSTSSESRIHAAYNITGAKTEGKDTADEEGKKSFGRWSSSRSIILPYGQKNLQNIPEYARKMFTAQEGYKIVQADLIQAEAVVVGYLINDQRLKKMFKDAFGLKGDARKPFDIHRHTAAMMFGVPFEDITDKQRGIGKTIRHAGNYSAGPGVVAVRLGVNQTVAKTLIKLYHNTCPQLKLWHMHIQEQLKRNRTLVTPMGRIHKFLGRWGDDLFRSAYAYIPQSTVGDILNEGYIEFYDKYGKDVETILQLHDAIYHRVKEDEVVDCIHATRECLLRPVEVNRETMTIDVDFKVGDSWGELKEFTDY